MNDKKPSKDAKKPVKPRQYKEPGETPGMREGLTPEGEKLEDINTKEEERGGLQDEEPTRYGDWTSKGRCTDF